MSLIRQFWFYFDLQCMYIIPVQDYCLTCTYMDDKYLCIMYSSVMALNSWFVFSFIVIDADGDIVRCRFPTPNNYNECGYLCNGLPGSTIETVCVIYTRHKILEESCNHIWNYVQCHFWKKNYKQLFQSNTSQTLRKTLLSLLEL